MIVRIVKMSFREENIQDFLEIFEASKQKIRNFEGVEHLELLRQANAGNIFFTYSLWRSEKELENYRQSELFKEVWAKTKALFSAKAEAWSCPGSG